MLLLLHILTQFLDPHPQEPEADWGQAPCWFTIWISWSLPSGWPSQPGAHVRRLVSVLHRVGRRCRRSFHLMRAQEEMPAKEPEPGLRSASILKSDLVTCGAVSDKGVIQVALPGVSHRLWQTGWWTNFARFPWVVESWQGRAALLSVEWPPTRKSRPGLFEDVVQEHSWLLSAVCEHTNHSSAFWSPEDGCLAAPINFASVN